MKLRPFLLVLVIASMGVNRLSATDKPAAVSKGADAAAANSAAIQKLAARIDDLAKEVKALRPVPTSSPAENDAKDLSSLFQSFTTAQSAFQTSMVCASVFAALCLAILSVCFLQLWATSRRVADLVTRNDV